MLALANRATDCTGTRHRNEFSPLPKFPIPSISVPFTPSPLITTTFIIEQRFYYASAGLTGNRFLAVFLLSSASSVRSCFIRVFSPSFRCLSQLYTRRTCFALVRCCCCRTYAPLVLRPGTPNRCYPRLRERFVVSLGNGCRLRRQGHCLQPLTTLLTCLVTRVGVKQPKIFDLSKPTVWKRIFFFFFCNYYEKFSII